MVVVWERVACLQAPPKALGTRLSIINGESQMENCGNKPMVFFDDLRGWMVGPWILSLAGSHSTMTAVGHTSSETKDPKSIREQSKQLYQVKVMKQMI